MCKPVSWVTHMGVGEVAMVTVDMSLAQPQTKPHLPGSSWVTRTLHNNGHRFPVPVMVFYATPGMELCLVLCHITFLFVFLLTLKSLCMSTDEKLPFCPELCHHSEGRMYLCIHLNHIGGPLCVYIRCLRLGEIHTYLHFLFKKILF